MLADVPVFEFIGTEIFLCKACGSREENMVQETTGCFCIFFRFPLAVLRVTVHRRLANS